MAADPFNAASVKVRSAGMRQAVNCQARRATATRRCLCPAMQLAEATRVRLYLPGLGGDLAPDEDIPKGTGQQAGGAAATGEPHAHM